MCQKLGRRSSAFEEVNDLWNALQDSYYKTALMEHRIALPFSETTQKDQRVRFCSAGWSANAQRARWLAPIL
jgi:hypothetical protein